MDNLSPEGLVSVMEMTNYSTFWNLDKDINEFANTSSNNEVYKPL